MMSIVALQKVKPRQEMLSKNFSVEEFEKSATAIREGIVNKMTDDHKKKAKSLCENVLQKVRKKFGLTIITSGYRCPVLCLRIGSSRTSQHTTGGCADFECIGVSNLDLAKWIEANCEFDKLILEFHTEGDPNSGWVHCSYMEEGNRNKVMTAKRVPDPKRPGKMKTIYTNGLPE